MTEVEILFRENYMPLVHYLMKMVSKEDAEEIAVDCGARVILKLYFLGLKTTEIASRLHISARTVLNQKSRAIKLIKEAVAQ